MKNVLSISNLLASVQSFIALIRTFGIKCWNGILPTRPLATIPIAIMTVAAFRLTHHQISLSMVPIVSDVFCLTCLGLSYHDWRNRLTNKKRVSAKKLQRRLSLWALKVVVSTIWVAYIDPKIALVMMGGIVLAFLYGYFHHIALMPILIASAACALAALIPLLEVPMSLWRNSSNITLAIGAALLAFASGLLADSQELFHFRKRTFSQNFGVKAIEILAGISIFTSAVILFSIEPDTSNLLYILGIVAMLFSGIRYVVQRTTDLETEFKLMFEGGIGLVLIGLCG